MKDIRCDIIDGCSKTTFKWLMEDEKSIWYEIPKCASTSMKNIYLKGINKVKIPIVDKQHESYLKFCVVRNPWDRMVSCWKDFSGKRKNLSHMLFGKVYDNFDEFMDMCFVKRNHHWEEQHKFLDRYHGELFVDKIIKLENFIEDIKDVHFLKKSDDIMNKTEHSNYKGYYNYKTKDMVYDEFKKDINYFDYEF